MNHDEEMALLNILMDKIKFVPGDELLPGTDYHVCLTHPIQSATNYEGRCSACNQPIYFGNQTALKKICTTCFLTLTKGNDDVEVYGNTGSIHRALLRHRLDQQKN